MWHIRQERAVRFRQKQLHPNPALCVLLGVHHVQCCGQPNPVQFAKQSVFHSASLALDSVCAVQSAGACGPFSIFATALQDHSTVAVLRCGGARVVRRARALSLNPMSSHSNCCPCLPLSAFNYFFPSPVRLFASSFCTRNQWSFLTGTCFFFF